MKSRKMIAENPHVRFDEGEVALSATPRRGSLLYSRKMIKAASAVLLIAAAALWSNEAVSADFDVDLRTARIEASTPLNESVRIAVEELEKIVAILQSDNCKIDELKTYAQKSVELIKFCKSHLTQTDEEVKKLLENIA